jgi:hypothetical protein
MSKFSDLILDEPLIKEEEEPDHFYMNDFNQKDSILQSNDIKNDLSLLEFLYKNSCVENRSLYIMGFIILALDQILKNFKTETYFEIQHKFTLKKELLIRDYTLKLFFKTLNEKNQKELTNIIQDILQLYIIINKKGYDCHIIYDTYKNIENKYHFRNNLYDIYYDLQK